MGILLMALLLEQVVVAEQVLLAQTGLDLLAAQVALERTHTPLGLLQPLLVLLVTTAVVAAVLDTMDLLVQVALVAVEPEAQQGMAAVAQPIPAVAAVEFILM